MTRFMPLLVIATVVFSCTTEPEMPPAHIDRAVAPVVQEFADRYFAQLHEDRVTGMSVAVVSPERILWADSHGWADRRERVPADVDTSYLIGSVTKVFTALAVMQLVDDGAVDLDRAYQSYVPEFAMKSRFGPISQITVRHLLTHHAGIPDDVWAGKFSESPAELASIIEIVNDMHTCYPPGEIRVYSNLGYALLGYLVERVSGTPYQAYIRERIFAPAGMDSSGFFTHASQRSAHAVAYDARRRQQSEVPLLDAPAGSISSTVLDMARLLQALLRDDGTLVSPSSLAQMLRLQNLEVALDLDDRVGLCFTITERSQAVGRVYEHGGATLYHRAQIYLAPDAGLAAVVLSNSERGSESAWMVNEQLMADLAGGSHAESPQIPQKLVTFAPRTGTDPATLAGHYAMPGVLYEVTAKHGMPQVSIDGNRFYLQLESRDAYVPARRILGRTIAWPEQWFLFHELDGRKVMVEAMPWGDLVLMGERVRQTPIDPAWSGYYGRYSLVPAEGEHPVTGDLQLRERDGFPVLTFSLFGRRDVELALRTLNDSEAVTVGLGRMGGETVRIEHGNSGYDLWFKGARYVREQ